MRYHIIQALCFVSSLWTVHREIATDILSHSLFIKAGIRLPEMYDQLFSQHQRSGRVSLSTLNSILSKGKISAQQIEMVGFYIQGE